jgi:subtilisin
MSHKFLASRECGWIVRAALLLMALGILAVIQSVNSGEAAYQGRSLGGSAAQKIAPEVTEALTSGSSATVIVNLASRGAPSYGPRRSPDVAALAEAISAEADSVLASVPSSQFRVVQRYQAIPALVGEATPAGVAALAAHPGVVHVTLNQRLQADLSEAVPLINADDVHSLLGITGAGVVVALLDTGIDTDHPLLSDDILWQQCFLTFGGCPTAPSILGGCPHNAVTSSAFAEDGAGHGSHVSGIITSNGPPVGVAPDAGIEAFKILDDCGSGSFADVLSAYNEIILNHSEVDVINMSLGDSLSHPPGTCEGVLPALTGAITTTRSMGITTFAASGNNGSKTGLSYPACINDIVSIGAVYDANLGPFACDTFTAPDRVTCFSQSDVSLDLLAPGALITSTVPGGGLADLAGTSMASPMAAAVAALLLESEPTLTPAQVETRLTVTGIPIVDTGNGVTTCRVDAYEAVINNGGPICGAPPPPPVSFFDVTYALRNCNDLPSIAPWTTFGLNGPDTHGPGGAGGPDTVSDCHANQEGASVQILTPNTITDLSTRLCVPGRTAVTDCPASGGAPNLGSMNFSSAINYVPNGYRINCKGTCPATMPSDTLLGADLAVGELVGGGDNSVHLQAATQGDCLSTFQVPFTFYNVALPSVGVVGAPSVAGNPDPRTSGNIAFPRNEGHADRFGRWNVGSIPADGDPNNVVDGTADNKADSSTLSIQNYPSYLLDAFDPDFIPDLGDNADGGPNLPPAVPVAVYGGMTQPVPASTDWVPLYFVQFAPGQLANGAGTWGAPHPFSTYVAANGAANVVVLNDPTAVKASVSAIQDSCSHVRSNTMLLGTGQNGHVRFKTPATAGSYYYINETTSQRDADSDGRENAFDTCPNTSDTFPGNDTDGDGVYNSCDPNPAVAADVAACPPRTCTATDKDGDGFDNEQDNCPLVHNGLPPVDVTGDGQKETELTLLTWPADGGPKTDSIGDACDPNQSVANGAFLIDTAITPLTIHAGNGPMNCSVFEDADCDGFTKNWETYMGTDPADNCPATVAANDEAVDAWPPDNNDNRRADLGDILAYIPVFGLTATTPAQKRFDMNTNGRVDLTDILMFIPYFGVTCVP